MIVLPEGAVPVSIRENAAYAKHSYCGSEAVKVFFAADEGRQMFIQFPEWEPGLAEFIINAARDSGAIDLDDVRAVLPGSVAT